MAKSKKKTERKRKIISVNKMTAQTKFTGNPDTHPTSLGFGYKPKKYIDKLKEEL